MASMLMWQAIGNIGGDPELKYLASGQAVANFSVAVNREWKDKAGEKHSETSWLRVSTWGKLAEVCSQYLKKGQQVFVWGEWVKQGAYLGSDGTAKPGNDFVANKVVFIGGRSAGTTLAETEDGFDPDSGDEIPF